MGCNHLTKKRRACLSLTDDFLWGGWWNSDRGWFRAFGEKGPQSYPGEPQQLVASVRGHSHLPWCSVLTKSAEPRGPFSYVVTNACWSRKANKYQDTHDWTQTQTWEEVQEQAKAGPKTMSHVINGSLLRQPDAVKVPNQASKIRERLESVTSKLQPPHKIQLPCGRVASQSLVWSKMS